MIAGRHSTGFGATPEYHPVNRLTVPEVAMRVNKKNYFHPIMKQGQWVVKKLDFSIQDSVTLRCRVTGIGMGYLYASFNNQEGPSILVIKKVTQGFHDLKFRVPYPVLQSFKIGISTTIPKGYSTDRLSKESRYKLSTNSMMVSQSTPMYESPGIGFGGLGAPLQDHTVNLPKGGEDSANNPYWNGDWDSFSWDNGFSGDPAHPLMVQSGAKSPAIQGEYHGYYAHRASHALAKFNKMDQFLGWDVIESQEYGIPAGVPICMILQFFVLPKKTKSGGDISGAADREMQDPYWKYAHDYQIPPDKMHLVNAHWKVLRVEKYYGSDIRPNNKSKGVIKNIGRGGVLGPASEGYGFRLPESKEDANGNWTGVKTPAEIAAKVEWYNESNGTWSSPSRSPQFIPKTNKDGFTKVICRIPRQLSKATDKDMIAELEALGVDYSYETNKQNVPGITATDPPRQCFNIIGRPVEKGQTVLYTEDAIQYQALSKEPFNLILGYGTHPYAGKAGNDNGGPKPGCVWGNHTNFKVSDPEKMARMNNPEILNAFYPVGGFKTGGVVIAIGRGMHLQAKYVMKDTTSGSTDNIYRNTTNPSSDGTAIGTRKADILDPTGIILSTDLEDDRAAAGEEAVLAAWKAKFGTPLTAQFFSDYSFKDQDPEKPTHYRVKDTASGLWIQAPYQIIYFKIQPEYAGPYVDYEIVTEEETKDDETFNVTKLKINKPEGKKYALVKGDSLWLHCRTPYAKFTKQNIEIIEEVEEQRVLKEAGLSDLDTLVYNPVNNVPEENTAAAAEAAQEAQRLRDLALLESPEAESPEIKLPRGAKYIRSEDKWKVSPRYFAREGQLKNAGLLGGIKSTLGGFTDQRDFYVEDVTQKWGASGSSTASPSNIAGLGAIWDGLLDPINDAIADKADDIMEATSSYIKTIFYGGAVLAGTVVFGPKLLKAGLTVPSIVVNRAKHFGKEVSGTSGTSTRGTAARRRRNKRR